MRWTTCRAMVSSAKEGSMNERRDEEVRVEGEERAEERGVGGDGLRELREGAGHVDGGRLGVGDEVGEAEQADRAALLGSEEERGSVAL